TSMRRSCTCAGMVFHTEPGSNMVRPTRSWQLSQTSGCTYWLMMRALDSSAEPRCTFFAMSRVMCTVWQVRCAGALIRNNSAGVGMLILVVGAGVGLCRQAEMHLLRHVVSDVHRRAGAVRRGAEKIEQRGRGRIVARKAERDLPHADIDRLLEAERMIPPADA